MRVIHLKHFAFRKTVRGRSDFSHGTQIPCAHHHLEGARVKEVADQNRGGVIPLLICRRTAAAHRGIIHHVVMHQRGGVEDFNNGAEEHVLIALVTERFRNEQHERRAHPLAAGARNVVSHFGNTVDAAAE